MNSRLRPLVAFVAASFCLGLSASAHAQGPLPALPAAPATMTTPDGQVVVVVPTPPGTTIAVLPPLPSATPPPPVMVAPPAPAPVEVRPLAGPTALVHLNGPASLTLEVVLSGETTWKPLCGAPCDVAVPLDALYRVTAPSSSPTKAFSLVALPGERVVVDAEPSSDGSRAGGEALMITGGIGIVGGGVILYVDALSSAVCLEAGCGPGRGVFITGVSAMALGTAALIAGIVLVQPTSVEQSTTPRAPNAGPTASRDRWLRTPTWHEAAPEAAALPKSMTIPLFTRSF